MPAYERKKFAIETHGHAAHRSWTALTAAGRNAAATAPSAHLRAVVLDRNSHFLLQHEFQ